MSKELIHLTPQLRHEAFRGEDRWPVHKGPKMRKNGAQYWYFGAKRIVTVQDSVRIDKDIERYTAIIMHSSADPVKESIKDFNNLIDAWDWARKRALAK